MATLRRAIAFSMVILLGVVTTSCGSPSVDASANNTPATQQQTASQNTRITDGKYPIQQANYDDGTGEYQLALLNTVPGQPAIFKTDNLQMARLTDEEVMQKTGNYLKVENGQPSLHIAEDFKIEYVHNVTETVADPQTGQPQTVVVRQESNFWAPFAGAVAGQAVGSLLFRPQYYFPPVYQPGGILRGHGGYGRTYDQAASNYRTRYQAPPAEVKNRQVFRSTGRVRSPQTTTRPRTPTTQPRSSGSGFGSNTLRQRNSNPQYQQRKPSFGSSGVRRSAPRRRR
ncbi:MAG: hypothetical protein KME11_03880 [Timaviella obliquedivisa GSE-PSE-MK23-08B]|nr:hypothetical protein [Timaviella obliquedivisa GSE-PSE-MK23-08B]